MGFGRSAIASTLGQTLDFAAIVHLDANESLGRGCVAADVTAGDHTLPAAAVRATLEAAADPRQRRIRVTTTTRIDEPIVAVHLSIGCGSKVSRRFVSFIDPPLLTLAQAAAADVAPRPEKRFESRAAPVVEAAQRSRAMRRDATSTGAARSASPRRGERRIAGRPARGQRMADASKAAPVSTAARSRRAPATPAPSEGTSPTVASADSPGSRLRLERPTPLAAAPAAASSPVATLPVSPAALAVVQTGPPEAAGEAASAALAGERIQTLEAGLARLRNESESTRQTVATLQARLRQAEGERYANWLVFALAGLAALLTLLAAALWWLRPRQRRQSRWFDATGSEQAAARRDAARADQPTPPVAPVQSQRHASEAPPAWNDRASSILPTAPATIGGLEVTTVHGPAPIVGATVVASLAGDGRGEPQAGDLSVEELIDIEQQAEFFVVLGQDEAAIELLAACLERGSGASPLPYLQLLEIQQRRGEEADYERTRTAFNKRFNAFAPDWNSDLQVGRPLDDYPQTIARLQALWPTPLHAMKSLNRLLFRRDESADTFDYPAYRELLFLYSIARELAGHVETDSGSIDLFLPLEDAANAHVMSAGDPGRASAYIDFDVSSWQGDPAADDPALRRSAG